MVVKKVRPKEKHLAHQKASMMALMMDSKMAEKKVRPMAEMRADLMVQMRVLMMDWMKAWEVRSNNLCSCMVYPHNRVVQHLQQSFESKRDHC